MISQIKWLDRTFQFGWASEYLPIFLNRLTGTVPRIKSMVRDFPNDLLIYKPNGAWSIKEHIGHLIDLESLHHDRILQLKSLVDVLTPADLSNQATNQAIHNEQTIDDLIQTLHRVRTHFIQDVRSLNKDHLNHAAYHERLDKLMNPVDICFFCAEHDDHHLAIIERLTERKR